MPASPHHPAGAALIAFEQYYEQRGERYATMGCERIAINKTLPQFVQKTNTNQLNSALRLAVNVNDTALALRLLEESQNNARLRKLSANYTADEFPVIEIDHVDRFQFRAIDDAVSQGNTYMAKILRDHHANLDAPGNGEPLLIKAAREGHFEMIRLLIEKFGLDPDECDANSFCPLHWCVQYEHQRPALVELLAHGGYFFFRTTIFFYLPKIFFLASIFHASEGDDENMIVKLTEALCLRVAGLY